MTTEEDIRPKSLEDFIGQQHLKNNLLIAIKAAIERNDTLDHILFYGSPGLGKTTLSMIISNEMRSNLKIISGPVISKPQDMNAVLSNLKHGDVLFIDEIHRLNASVEETLYSAMEDFALDIVIGDGNKAKTIRINLPRFTLIGATTRIGLLTPPLRDRFGLQFNLESYNLSDMDLILKRFCKVLSLNISDEGIREMSVRSRKTPRIAIRICRRIRDFIQIANIEDEVSKDFILKALETMKIDEYGLNTADYKYLKFIFENYKDKPVGIETISTGILEKKDSVEDCIEPYLIQIGFLNKTSRGRSLTLKALNHIEKQNI